MQGTSRSFPTYRGMLYSISKFVTLYLACLCTIGVFATNSNWSITTRWVSCFSLSDPSGGGSLCYVCSFQGAFSTAVFLNWPANLMCCNNICFGKCHICHVCHDVLFSLLLIRPVQKTPYNRHFLRQLAKYYCSNENIMLPNISCIIVLSLLFKISAVASKQAHFPQFSLLHSSKNYCS